MSPTQQQPPLSSLLVLEFAGLAPGPFAGKLLADHGARVLRIDRHTTTATGAAAPDVLAEHKRSIGVDVKSAAGAALVRRLAATADVLIDPFRPGVLERLGLGPAALCRGNERLVYARLTGFRRDGKYRDMAGHDINYIAVSGVLSLLGRAHETPHPPANLLGDFAGGGAACFVGILLALLKRAQTGRGQVVEANMVDGSAYLASLPRLMLPTPAWCAPRGSNLLDGGAPFYDTYRTEDGGHMAVGALEPQFYDAFITRLFPEAGAAASLPSRDDRTNWGRLRELFAARFLQKPRTEWERVFDGSDACVTPVKTHDELRAEGFVPRPMVTLRESGAVPGDGWRGKVLRPGEGGREALTEWWRLEEGVEWVVRDEARFEVPGGRGGGQASKL